MKGLVSDTNDSIDTLRRQASRLCDADPTTIETVTPCTTLQCSALKRLSYIQQSHIGHIVYEVPLDVKLDRLASSWSEIVHQTPALRTRIVPLDPRTRHQVTITNCFTWTKYSDELSKTIKNEETEAEEDDGSPCNRYALLETPSKRYLVWTFSHLLVDKTLQDHTLRKVLAAYDGTSASAAEKPADASNGDANLAVSNNEDQEEEKEEALAGQVFPVLPPNQKIARPEAQAEHSFPLPTTGQQIQNKEAICHVALAMLLCRYTDSPVALFGAFQQQTSSRARETGGKSPRAVTPLYVRCLQDQPLSSAIKEVTSTGPRGGDGSVDDPKFQTVLEVVEGEEPDAPVSRLHQFVEASNAILPYANGALLLSCQIRHGSGRIHAHYDSRVIDPKQMARFLRQLGGLINQCHHADINRPLRDLNVLPPEDRAEIMKWNRVQPETQAFCIHDLISQRASQMPQEDAVCAWDGSWSYGDLERLSSRLASHILSGEHEVGPIVPLCLDKSKWVLVAILAVLKTGKAFSLIDPGVPTARMAQICHQTSATFAIASTRHIDTMKSLVADCLCVEESLLATLEGEEYKKGISVSPSPDDIAYVLFTSGSTGQPKGARITHQGFITCSVSFAPAVGLRLGTRALQFASYAFGPSLVEMLSALMQGGCVCFPSDDERMNDIAGFINRMGITWALFTPSFIGAISPEQVPNLKTLQLGGETISPETRDLWAPRVEMRYAYGQSEAATICSVAEVMPDGHHINNIGRPTGARLWVTEVGEPDRLCPIGCIGELLVESIGVGKGYLGATPEQSSNFLTKLPAWYPAADRDNPLPFFKTGDLVCYESDGTLRYLGRKDTQIKIRGQRLELGEIESKIRPQLPSQLTAVVEAVEPQGAGRSKSTVLLAFIVDEQPNGGDHGGAERGRDPVLLEPQAAEDIKRALQQELAAYAIPLDYIRVFDRPMTATGKTDRKKLRSIGARMLSEGFQRRARRAEETETESATDPESVLRQLWHETLQLDPRTAQADVDFFQAGGDSIAAIKLVNRARSAGIKLSVRDVLENPTHNQLKLKMDNMESSQRLSITPSEYKGPVKQSFAQGRLWFLDQLNMGASWYNMPFAVRLRGSLNVSALTTALHALEQRHETLRTVFTESDGEGMQILKPCSQDILNLVDLSAKGGNGFMQDLHDEQTAPFNLASELGWRATLFRLGPDDHILSIVLHHIIADGWSVDILSRELDQFYEAACRGVDPLTTLAPLPVQYRDFSIWQQEDSRLQTEVQKQLRYWSLQLADSSPAEFLTDKPRPSILSGKGGSIPVTVEGTLYQSLREFCRVNQVTPYITLLAAFRATHFRMSGAGDATIGTPSANRNQPELEPIVGFFVNTQCMRVTVEEDETFQSLVSQVKETSTDAFANQDVSCLPPCELSFYALGYTHMALSIVAHETQSSDHVFRFPSKDWCRRCYQARETLPETLLCRSCLPFTGSMISESYAWEIFTTIPLSQR